MDDTELDRTSLRRETYAMNESLVSLVVRLTPLDPAAASAVKRARSALFEAWTVLCVPPDDDDHDH